MFFIELEPLFNNEGMTKPLEFTADMKNEEYNGVFPFVSPVFVSGAAENRTGIVSLCLTARFTLNLTCDRCAKVFSREYVVPVNHDLVTEIGNDNGDECLVKIDSYHFDVETLVREDILLYLPSKVLCREDCRGICYRCGKDLNDGPCDCGRDFDPRWDALQQLLEDDR